jgi:glycerol-3-phosphate dehydrogenase
MDPYDIFNKAEIPADRVEAANSKGLIEQIISVISGNLKEVDSYRPSDVAIIGAGDFGIALSKSFKSNVNIVFYDPEPVRNTFSRISRISTNRSFALHLSDNIDFTSSMPRVVEARFIIICVPANAIPDVINKIKETDPVSYKEKNYVLVSKGFIGRGYIPHRWLEKNGIPFERIIWASGGNVAKDLIQKKKLNISVVSINKNRRSRREFVSLLSREYFTPFEYSGSALLACELGGILKNYYAGLGRFILLKHGEDALYKYKVLVRKEFRRAVRMVSSSPTISIRAWVIRKASHGPAFWEDLDVTIREGRNGFFGEKVFNGLDASIALKELGLVESFKTVFSTLSLFNRLSKHAFSRLPILKSILEMYEELQIDYMGGNPSKLSEESKVILENIERKVLNYKSLWF